MNREEVMDKLLDSRDATVGGGSASAFAAAMAAGMGGMVARLSVGRDLGLVDSEYIRLADRLDVLAADLSDGAVRDTESYSGIVAAYKLPKAGEKERAARGKAINDAGIAAASEPLRNGRMAVEVAEILENIFGKHNPGTESDLLIARHLAAVGIRGCILNVKANLPLIKDEQAKNDFEAAMAELRQTL